MRHLIFAFILLPISTFADTVVQNEVIRDIYIDNCSTQSGIKICYPQREDNIGELIQMYQNCEDQNFGVVTESVDCLDVRKRKIAERECAMLPEGSFLMDSCIDMEMELVSSEEAPALESEIIRCEGLYQEVLAQSFSDEFPGLNISFVTGVREPDFLHNVVYPKTIFGSSRDVLLLPERSNGAFCNEDGNIDLNEIQGQIQKAKEIMQTFYETDEFNTALEILEEPQGDLNILSITCPTLLENEETEVIGQHTLIESEKDDFVATPAQKEQPVERKKYDERSCMSSELIALIDYHQEQIAGTNNGVFSPYGMGYALGDGPKQFDYFPPIGNPIEHIISNACSALDGRLELTVNGGYVDGEKLPSSMVSTFQTGINLDAPDEARYFAEKLNDLAEGADVESLDGTQVYEAMIAQDAILKIKEAKQKAMRVAPDGYYLQQCGFPMEVYEVRKGYILSTDCTEEKVPNLDNFDMLPPPGMGPGEMYQDDEFEYEGDQYDDEYEDEYEDDTGI